MDDTVQEKALPVGRRKVVALVGGAVVVAAVAVGVGLWGRSEPPSGARQPVTSASAAPGSGSGEPSSEEPPAAESGPPQTGPLDVELSPGRDVRITDDGGWSGHGSLSGIVTVTNPGDSTSVNPLVVELTVPTEYLHLGNRDDDRWDCSVEDYGMRCEIPNAVGPGESWPELLIGFVEDRDTGGTFTATASGPGIGEDSVEFGISTSL